MLLHYGQYKYLIKALIFGFKSYEHIQRENYKNFEK